jgi:DNA topoisomerase I
MSSQFMHNGVIVPPKSAPRGLALTIRCESRALTPHQEEMAIAWARKIGTEYAQDSGFCKNFMRDFSAALGVKPALSTDEVDFGPAIAIVQAERAAKEAMTPEERKARAAQRKAEREELKEKYGHATLNGERVELGNYMVEPSGIFMGRGKHPLRGKWKDGAGQSDITLNLSPDAPRPVGEWAGIVWHPESLWVARWEDKLAGKVKYVWLSDTAPVKQEREAAKFDKAVTLDERLADVRAHIETALADPDPRRREVATVCYLIDALCMRVGDEKDEDEADTVGATTLRPEHVTLHEDGTAEFRFLGKDSVLWHKKIQPPPVVLANMAALIANARPDGDGKPQIFPAIDSGDVNAFLGEALPGLTAKVFRTHHATEAVRNSLTASGVTADDPEYKKVGAAAQANLEAAILCNHFRKAPANWKERRAKSGGRKDSSQAQVAKLREQAALAKEALSALRREAADAKRKAAAKTSAQRKTIKARYEQRTAQARKRLETAQARLDRAETSLGKLKVQDTLAAQSRTWNLGTSLKSYIDPRVYYRWGQQAGFDVLGKYYPKTLQRKFAWASEPTNA